MKRLFFIFFILFFLTFSSCGNEENMNAYTNYSLIEQLTSITITAKECTLYISCNNESIKNTIQSNNFFYTKVCNQNLKLESNKKNAKIYLYVNPDQYKDINIFGVSLWINICNINPNNINIDCNYGYYEIKNTSIQNLNVKFERANSLVFNSKIQFFTYSGQYLYDTIKNSKIINYKKISYIAFLTVEHCEFENINIYQLKGTINLKLNKIYDYFFYIVSLYKDIDFECISYEDKVFYGNAIKQIEIINTNGQTNIYGD